MTEPAILAGRQPTGLKKLAPSGRNPWYGTITNGTDGRLGVEGGDRFTVEQILHLRDMGLRPDKVDTIAVKRNATDNEAYWNTGQVPPQYHFDCPIVARKRGGKLSVICPGGWVETVKADGWIGVPGKPKRPMW